MNKKFNLKSVVNGLYFVQGAGFTGTKAQATALDEQGAQCLRNLGFAFTSEAANKSFGVCYIRKDDLNPDHTVKANAKNPSRRRFATVQEAHQHGARFNVRKANGSRVAGSAGHVGFYVVETTDPVNAVINWATGLTNPVTA